MEQVEVCSSWEEFDDNSKLLEQQLEKLKLQKGLHTSRTALSSQDTNISQSSLLQSQSSSSEPSEGSSPKMKVMKRQVPTGSSSGSSGSGNSSGEEGTSNGQVLNSLPLNSNHIQIQEESIRTPYVPPEPRISILSRPKKSSSNQFQNNSSKAKNQPVKTLEQREQEYAEARRRIFGDDFQETEDTDEAAAQT